ncbi:myosin-binding protein 3-like [Andrographis paniculata]|uniref:myosin-binding protein 3-like n=1 Tax=Andrographis paniculata TaxID=175694 RepID=UPI0021E89E07|nr:myosin-binding protein 3-like [Andrographis paniculata]XP_051145089.1 myosin-binding protein 3-like [Andrographis paniculata]
MAANKFASMVHRNSNKITLILVYAVLEWILIVLILLNSLFTYSILKFAEYFGLKRPCLWCTRIDHIFDRSLSKGGKKLPRDHLCEAHSMEVSRLGFCSSHQKLVESQNLCGDCVTSSSSKNGNDGEVKLSCSCCGASLTCNKLYASWDVLELECAQKVNFVKTFEDDEKKETSDLTMEDKSVQVCVEELDTCVETSTQHLEFCLDYSGHTLVPIETNEDDDDDGKNKGQEVAPDLQIASKEDGFIDVDLNEEPHQCLMEIEEDENSLFFHPKTAHLVEAFDTFPIARWPSEDIQYAQELVEASMDAHSDIEEAAWESNGNNADVSIGTEIPDLDIIQEHDDFEEKVPDTPTSMEKRDYEESLDGSVMSEMDGCDGAVMIEQLRSALREERKALRVLYSELEEERSAAAVAANQTMAMINRLQEEKAAMQMEALQYQRMMEEQSEYDQEALQLLNELMVKREKEKQEVERELEGYRKKLLEYDRNDTTRVSRNSSSSRNGVSSGEDSDGVSVDLNREEHTPVDAVFDLEEFEEERLSILEQLKLLEEKLLTLDNHGDDDEVREVEVINGHTNGFANGAKSNGHRHNQRVAAGCNGRSLLPLFDAISDENGMNHDGVQDSYAPRFGMREKKLAVEEEVDNLYDRLQALEADGEFLKHCIGSLKKGDKGMDLLQEILRHLRDLRSIEHRVRPMN